MSPCLRRFRGWSFLAIVVGWTVLVTPWVAAAEPARAETDPKPILAVIQRFFDAMAARDAATVLATVAPEGQIQTLNDDGRSTKQGFVPLKEFAARVPTWKQRPLERIWNPTVHVHGRIATVWAPYDFHRDGVFSHSGIDVFTLMRAGDEWKIVSLAFTMEPHVPSQHPDGPPPRP